MRRLRTASTRRLAAILAAVAALALTAAIAQAALTGAGPVPAPKALANAVLDALKAPAPDGLRAKIHFTNNLLPSGSLPGGASSPLAAGADGRLWVQKSGNFRLELQSDAGDAQIVSDGETVTVYDASSNTVYRATLPTPANAAAAAHDDHGDSVTLAKVRKALAELSRTWTISGAEPSSTAGRPAYTVKISPADDGGLLGGAQVAWDALTGAPLRAAVYAQGQTDPVLELEATDVSYDAVADADVRVRPPAGAKVDDLTADGGEPAGHGHASRGHSAGVEGLQAVERALGHDVVAPDTLAGLPRRAVRLVRLGGDPGALTVYGRGFGAIAVVQHRVEPGATRGKRGGERSLRLPEINIDGATGSELATALGTVVTFERDGVAYVVAGSVPPVAAENAARGLK